MKYRKPVETKAESVDTYPYILDASEYFEVNEEIELRSYLAEAISQKSIDVTEKLENGLIGDFRYYKTVVKFNYVVAVHKKNRLTSEDFSCLFDAKWLSNTLIEYLLQVMLRESKNIEGSCIRAGLLFLDPSSDKFYKRFLKNYVLLPLWSSNHFVLFILDLKEKLIAYIDPKGESNEDFRKYMANFKLFLVKYNSKFPSIGTINEWRVKQFEHSFQADSVNCGVYVVRFCELFIIKEDIFIEEFDPYRYRKELKNMILATSEPNMVDYCLLCGQNNEQTLEECDWIQCDICERWLHSLSCAKVNNKDYPQGVLYKCPLCKSMKNVSLKQIIVLGILIDFNIVLPSACEYKFTFLDLPTKFDSIGHFGLKKQIYIDLTVPFSYQDLWEYSQSSK